MTMTKCQDKILGDKMFDWMLQEWMEFESLNFSTIYIVKTSFSKYTIDGRLNLIDKYPRLSLTECESFFDDKFTPIDAIPKK